MLKGLVDYASSDDEGDLPTNQQSVNQTTTSLESLNQKPISTQPISTQPISTQPISTQPISTQPISTQPISTQPISTKPLSTKPESNDDVIIETNSKIFSVLPSSKKKRKRDLKSVLAALDVESMLKEEIEEEHEDEEKDVENDEENDEEKDVEKDEEKEEEKVEEDDDEPELKKTKYEKVPEIVVESESMKEGSHFMQKFAQQLAKGITTSNETTKEEEENIEDNFETDPKMYEEVELVEEKIIPQPPIVVEKREFERSQMEIPEEVQREIKLSGAKVVNISASSALHDEELRRRKLIEKHKQELYRVPKIDDSLRPQTFGEPQKHHITYLAFQAQKRAAEMLEKGERAYISKREAWSKYGW